MFDFLFHGWHAVPRPSLYCVWIRAHAAEDAPLIRVWIDPSMTMFESQATVHEPDLAAARAAQSRREVTKKRGDVGVCRPGAR